MCCAYGSALTAVCWRCPCLTALSRWAQDHNMYLGASYHYVCLNCLLAVSLLNCIINVGGQKVLRLLNRGIVGLLHIVCLGLLAVPLLDCIIKAGGPRPAFLTCLSPACNMFLCFCSAILQLLFSISTLDNPSCLWPWTQHVLPCPEASYRLPSTQQYPVTCCPLQEILIDQALQPLTPSCPLLTSAVPAGVLHRLPQDLPVAPYCSLSLPQVFFIDSLKFFLSLYGHKLPVLCMDISSDSTLLVSGSADKNIKVGAGFWVQVP